MSGSRRQVQSSYTLLCSEVYVATIYQKQVVDINGASMASVQHGGQIVTLGEISHRSNPIVNLNFDLLDVLLSYFTLRLLNIFPDRFLPLKLE